MDSQIISDNMNYLSLFFSNFRSRGLNIAIASTNADTTLSLKVKSCNLVTVVLPYKYSFGDCALKVGKQKTSENRRDSAYQTYVRTPNNLHHRFLFFDIENHKLILIINILKKGYFYFKIKNYYFFLMKFSILFP